jgi:hypothetical protein
METKSGESVSMPTTIKPNSRLECAFRLDLNVVQQSGCERHDAP